jgi:hypothetical protein
MLLLHTINTALLHAADQILNKRSIRHHNHHHASVVQASQHAEQQALASAGQQHDNKQRLSVNHCVQRQLLLCQSKANVVLTKHLLHRLADRSLSLAANPAFAAS